MAGLIVNWINRGRLRPFDVLAMQQGWNSDVFLECDRMIGDESRSNVGSSPFLAPGLKDRTSAKVYWMTRLGH